ncbi:MAG TPA: serine O-acetyltransferase, partial [Lachnospiraceae bacterium]|nr:serine O-acetyltransferase [Lachnospiraceae bacterium]
YHQITLGANEHKKTNGIYAPHIGDGVYIGCGAKVIGGIDIGNNVIIGANAVVTKDIPNDCTVVGNPSYIVKMDGISLKHN